MHEIPIGKLLHLREGRLAAMSRTAALRSELAAHIADEQTARALMELDVAHEELRVAEEELQAQADAMASVHCQLDRERRLYGDLFEGAPEAYVVTDERGTIAQANVAATELFNMDRGWLERKPLLTLVADGDRHELLDWLSRTSVEPRRGAFRLRVRGRRSPLLASVTAKRDLRDDRSQWICWLLRPESEEGSRAAEAIEQLRARNHELEAARASLAHLLEREQLLRREADQKHAEKTRAIAEVGHEIRNALGTLAGWVHTLSDNNIAAGLQKRGMLSMTRSVRALARIADDFTDYCRFEHYTVQLSVAPLNLVRVVVEIIEDMRPLAALRDIRIEFAAESYKVDLHGDPLRLQQVFRNLLGNAIKFTPKQGFIRITIGGSASEAEVCISDTGRGIAPEALSKVFTPFAQLGTIDPQEKGLGLGLSIAQRIVEMHGGHIEVSSDGPLRGATFRVKLPRFAS